MVLGAPVPTFEPSPPPHQHTPFVSDVANKRKQAKLGTYLQVRDGASPAKALPVSHGTKQAICHSTILASSELNNGRPEIVNLAAQK